MVGFHCVMTSSNSSASCVKRSAIPAEVVVASTPASKMDGVSPVTRRTAYPVTPSPGSIPQTIIYTSRWDRRHNVDGSGRKCNEKGHRIFTVNLSAEAWASTCLIDALRSRFGRCGKTENGAVISYPALIDVSYRINSTGRAPPSTSKIWSNWSLYCSMAPSAWKCSPPPMAAI